VSPTEYQELVEFLGRRFEAIDRRFDQIDQRFGNVDRRFGEQDSRFTGLERQLTELRQEMLGHFDEIYRRLERLEQHRGNRTALGRVTIR
jgi:type IV secretion system protein TrbJ